MHTFLGVVRTSYACCTYFVRYLCACRTHFPAWPMSKVPTMPTYDNYAYESVRQASEHAYVKIMRTTKSLCVRHYSYACRTRKEDLRTTLVQTGQKMSYVDCTLFICTHVLRKMSLYWAHKNHTKCHQHKNVRTICVRHTYDYTACRTGSLRVSYVTLLLPWAQEEHVHQSLQVLRPR